MQFKGKQNQLQLLQLTIEIKTILMTDMTPNQKDFLLKEYDKLNNEVAKLLQEIRTREKYSLTIISLVSAWIYTEIIKDPNDNNIPIKFFIQIIHLLSWIPLVITFLYGVSVLLIYKNIKWIGGYLSIIETKFIDNLEYAEKKPFGWEKYFDDKDRKSHFVIWTWVFWIMQIIITIALIYKSYSIFPNLDEVATFNSYYNGFGFLD